MSIKQEQSQIDAFSQKFLLIQKKYEKKIDELSILKEMVDSMKSIDLTDQDLIWRRHLEYIRKYKNLSGSILYILGDFQYEKDEFISSCFDGQMDYSFLKQSKLMKRIVREKQPVLIDDLSRDKNLSPLEGSLYALPLALKDEFHGVLILLSDKVNGFKADEMFFYSIVKDYLMNTMVFRRFYFGKINEERQIVQLSRFFSKNVVQKILKSGSLRLGGERKRACVLFVDLKDFTTLSEKITSEEVVAILNEFFTHMIPIVFRNYGTMDKIIGDCIMAVFGAPIDDEKCSFRAVKTALEMFSTLHHFKNERRGYYSKLNMTIGINTGDLVAGFLGSETHLSYTVIGDTVNTAQRLQSLAGVNQIFLSSDAFNEISDEIDTLQNIHEITQLGSIKLKGKTLGLNVHRIVPQLF